MSINKETLWLLGAFLLGVVGAIGAGLLLGCFLQGLGALVTK
jgi:hypothetical protein